MLKPHEHSRPLIGKMRAKAQTGGVNTEKEQIGRKNLVKVNGKCAKTNTKTALHK